jgi:hypothetical protein
MATTTSGIVYPTLADDPDVPGDMLAMANSIEPFIAKPFAKLILGANQALANGSNTASVSFSGSSYVRKSHTSMHSTSVNPSRIIPPIAGWYRFTALAVTAINTTGYRTAAVAKNGVRQAPESGYYATPPAAVNTVIPVITCELEMNGSSDYAELMIFHNITGGGTLNAIGDGSSSTPSNCLLTCEYIRPLIP